MKRHALIVLGLVCAFVVGRLTLAAQSPTHTTTERVVERQPVEHRVVHAASSTSLTADDVRSIVSEALASRAPAAEAAESRPVDPQALTSAQTVVAEGTRDGRWTSEDRERLRPLVNELSREQARQVMTSLFAEINAGRVRLEVDGPPT